MIKTDNNDFLRLKDYSDLMVKRNLSYLPKNISEGMDFSLEACMNCDNYDDAIKFIRSQILNEKRRLLAIMQQHSKKNICGEKKCSKCKKTKDYSFFRKRVDNRNGFKFFDSICNECEKEKWKTI